MEDSNKVRLRKTALKSYYKQKAANPDLLKQRRISRTVKTIAVGICYQCGKNPLATKTFCRGCADKLVARNKGRWMALWAAGLCVNCRNPRGDDSTKYRCRGCADRISNVNVLRHRERNYGITPEQFKAMLKEQDFRCAICRTEAPLCVDHNHETGKVRQLLCGRCNMGLGAFGDDPDFLEIAALYLRIHKIVA